MDLFLVVRLCLKTYRRLFFQKNPTLFCIFRLWVFNQTFSVGMELPLGFLAFKDCSAITLQYKNIFALTPFMMSMEKKSTFSVLLSHIQAGGEKSRLLKKRSVNEEIFFDEIRITHPKLKLLYFRTFMQEVDVPCPWDTKLVIISSQISSIFSIFYSSWFPHIFPKSLPGIGSQRNHGKHMWTIGTKMLTMQDIEKPNTPLESWNFTLHNFLQTKSFWRPVEPQFSNKSFLWNSFC